MPFAPPAAAGPPRSSPRRSTSRSRAACTRSDPRTPLAAPPLRPVASPAPSGSSAGRGSRSGRSRNSASAPSTAPEPRCIRRLTSSTYPLPSLVALGNHEVGSSPLPPARSPPRTHTAESSSATPPPDRTAPRHRPRSATLQHRAKDPLLDLHHRPSTFFAADCIPLSTTVRERRGFSPAANAVFAMRLQALRSA